MSSGKDSKVAEIGKEVFLAMKSPQVFAISMFKVAFKDAAHKRGIWHHLNREGYNYHFRATMKEVKELIIAEKKHEQKRTRGQATKKTIIASKTGQLCLF